MDATDVTNSASKDAFKDLENFGRFHLIQYFLICLPLVMVSMINVNYIFVAEEVNHRCRVPGCDGANSTVDIPQWWPEGVDAKCFQPVLDINQYNILNQTCSNDTFTEILEDCHEWIYENHNSITSKLNLGCQSYKTTLVGSIHNAGMTISMVLTGWIADKIGRKPTIIACTIASAVGLFKIFVTHYYMYLALEFLESLLGAGIYTVAVVLLMEVGGETKRLMAGIIFSYAVYVGEVIYAFIAMGLKFWKTIIIIIYTPMVLFIFYTILLRESTRWQMIRGKMDEAKDTLKLIARNNKLNLTDEEISEVKNDELRSTFNVVTQKEKETIKDIIGSKETMIRVTVSSFCYFTSSFLYYGLTVHSILLPGNKYVNFALFALAAFPGDLLALFIFSNYGRRISLQCGYITSAIFLMAQTYTPDSLSWLKIILFLCGKLGVVVCFTGIFTYSLELFPTSVRGSLVGCGNTIGRVGSILAPLTLLLSKELTTLPAILFSSTAIIAAILLSFTPETKTLPLFDTIAQIAQVECHKDKISTHL